MGVRMWASCVGEAQVTEFELDPCLMNKRVAWNGAVTGQGNCTAPNQCICLCFERAWLDEDGEWVDVPWIDPLDRELPPGMGTGFGDCLDGFQGNLNADGSFRTCHMRAWAPPPHPRCDLRRTYGRPSTCVAPL